MRKKIILFDNFDSFTWNLFHLIRISLSNKNLDHEVLLMKNDDNEIFNHNPDAFIISPGPMGPNKTGLLTEYFDKVITVQNIPALGVCLGMQFLAFNYGDTVVESKNPVHGRVCEIEHNGKGIFSKIQHPFFATRYNSLEVKLNKTTQFNVDAVCKKSGMIMGVSHKQKKFYGIQFHPESFLTQNGIQIIDNFFTLCNV